MTHGIQVCFCGPDSTALPVEPLDAHDHFCLIWDWAMAHGKITPAQRIEQLEGSARELGLTDEELAREEASLRTFFPFREAAGHLMGATPLPLRPRLRPPGYSPFWNAPIFPVYRDLVAAREAEDEGRRQWIADLAERWGLVLQKES